jgi:hypothetical protein
VQGCMEGLVKMERLTSFLALDRPVDVVDVIVEEYMFFKPPSWLWLSGWLLTGPSTGLLLTLWQALS